MPSDTPTPIQGDAQREAVERRMYAARGGATFLLIWNEFVQILAAATPEPHGETPERVSVHQMRVRILRPYSDAEVLELIRGIAPHALRPALAALTRTPTREEAPASGSQSGERPVQSGEPVPQSGEEAPTGEAGQGLRCPTDTHNLRCGFPRCLDGNGDCRLAAPPLSAPTHSGEAETTEVPPHDCRDHAVDDGECSDGCCDRYRCTVCGKRWVHECPQ